MEWIYAIAALASALSAGLAWAAKLVWSKEYKEAKDETIRAKEAQIELLKNEIANLRELTPMKLREYFISVKQQLEEYIEKLQQDLSAKNEEISELQESGLNRESELRKLLNEKESLESKIKGLDEIVDEDFFERLMERKYFGFDLKLKGSGEAIREFLGRATNLGDSQGNVYFRAGDHYVINLSYSNPVSNEAINKLIRDMKLEVIEFHSVQGIHI